MTSTPRRKATRFSLLLLEDGEVLLSDFSVQYRFTPSKPIGSTLHPLNSYPERFAGRSPTAVTNGRIKIGTRNIFFDSDDWRDPIIRIPLISVDHARPTRDGSRSRNSEDATTHPSTTEDSDDNSVLVVANSAVFLRELGTDHPYIDVQLQGRHIFTPLYSSSNELLDEINTLLHICATTSRRKREASLKRLVEERESRVPFDITLLEHGVKENAMMDAAASAVYAMSRMPGRFRITQQNLYFMPIHGESSQAVERISTDSITTVRRLRHGFRDAALEVGYRESLDGKGTSFATLMVAFDSRQSRQRAIHILSNVVPEKVEVFNRADLDAAVSKWRNGTMSNFDYLMFLNFAAGRSFNDLSQYPVFPWVLKDFESDTLNLTHESSFRDLSLPIGALEPKRLNVFRQRYHDMPPPRFFYGTHYSTPAYTINYLVRAAPAAMLRLQNGKFDTPDRLFHSISSTWRGVLSNQGDVKELIPEFYALDYSLGTCSGVVPRTSSPGEFLDNVLGLDLGTRQDGKRVDDVELPPWAGGSSELFVRTNREALECDYVSARLHNWIDLIFGVKSRSADASNIFYTDVALPNSLESEQSSKLSEEGISQIETIYLEFGRTPERLFGHPHPPRFGDDRDIAAGEASAPQSISRPPPFPSPLNKSHVPSAIDEERTSSDESVDRNEISDDSSSGLSRNRDNVDTPLARGNVWGSNSRRHDSVLQGACDHILSPYEPSTRESTTDADAIPKLVTSNLIIPVVQSAGSAIVDMCLVGGDARSGEVLSLSSEGVKNRAICTLWDDGYIRVYSGRKLLRSKHVGDTCSVEYAHPSLVFFGTPGGSIGVYSIDTGRKEIVENAAHDAEVNAIECIQQSQTLISGSKDASVKIWHIERPSHRVASLKLIQELDAESCVEDIAGTTEMVNGDARTEGAFLLLAASTTDGEIMAWEVDLARNDQSFLEPVLRSSNDMASSTVFEGRHVRKRKLTWLYQGQRRRPALASVHDEEKCLRVWNVNQNGMPSAEAYISSGGARCVTACDESRTLLVGGVGGQISEFDSTGLCLGSVVTGDNEVRNILLPERGKQMYIFAGINEALRVNR